MKIELEIHIVGLADFMNLGLEFLRKLDRVDCKQEKLMALGQDILDAVTEEDTKVDSVIALLNGLVANGTITPEVNAAILAKIKGSESKLDAAIGANTPVPPAAP